MLEKDKPKFDSMNTTKQSQTVLVKQKTSQKDNLFKNLQAVRVAGSGKQS